MSFCTSCGTQILDGYRFCQNCGTPVDGQFVPPPTAAVDNQFVPPPSQAPAPMPGNGPFFSPQIYIPPIEVYGGSRRNLSISGCSLEFPPHMDAFNHYRSLFAEYAHNAFKALCEDYNRLVVDLDGVFEIFPDLYIHHREPLLQAACNLFMDVGIYDIPLSRFAEMHTADFCLAADILDDLSAQVDNAITENQNRRARAFSFVPDLIFDGSVSGIASAVGYSILTTKIAERSIRNANISPKQKQAIFQNLNADWFMGQCFYDYWRIFLSTCYQLNQHGLNMWYPCEADSTTAEGLLENLKTGRIPANREPQVYQQIINHMPYLEEFYDYLEWRHGQTSEIQFMRDFFMIGL